MGRANKVCFFLSGPIKLIVTSFHYVIANLLTIINNFIISLSLNMHRATAELPTKRYSDFSNRITHQEGVRRERINFYKSLLKESPSILLSSANDKVPTDNRTPSQRASLVVAYMCTYCGDLVDLQGYCTCCPDPEEVTAEDLWDSDEIYGSDSTESDSERDVPLKKRKQ